MRIRVAVVDPLPLCRRGVAATLSDLGYPVDTPDDVRAWLTAAPSQAIVLGVCGDPDWRLLAELCDGRPDLLLLAMIDKADVDSYARAVKAGASGVIARASSPTILQRSFTVMVDGQVLLPAAVVRSLATGPRDAGGRTEGPSEEERAWLRHLADGGTVAQLAESAGYSERMMFRHLRDLYRRLPARNRTEALIYARDNGWI
jgi:DNA-binding NarL/FixJ family response regulator